MAFAPAEAITVVLKSEVAQIAQGKTGTRFHFGTKRVQAKFFDRVLEPRMLARGTVAMVALRGEYRFGDDEQLLRGDETDQMPEQGIGAGVTVAGTHAATNADVESCELAVLDDGDEAEIMGEHVDIVVRWHGKGDLELAWQVGLAIQGLAFRFGPGEGHLIQPQFGVRARARFQVQRQAARPVVHLGVHPGKQRIGRNQDIAIDVTAGGNGVDQAGVDGLQGGFEFALDDAVKLEGLARGQAQRVVGEADGDGIQRQPLFGRDHATRSARANHEAVVRLQFLLATLFAQVAIVLLVAAVELDDGGVVLADGAGMAVRKALDQAAAQEAAALLDGFDVGRFGAHGRVPDRVQSGFSTRRVRSGRTGAGLPGVRWLSRDPRRRARRSPR